MEDFKFHLIEIGIQLLGFGILVFKGGKYVGEATGMFKTLFKNQEDYRLAQAAHEHADNERFEKVAETLTDIKVSVAGMGGRR